MAKPFIVQIKDDKQRRIVIDKDAWITERFESETPNPCVSAESVSSVFPSV